MNCNGILTGVMQNNCGHTASKWKWDLSVLTMNRTISYAVIVLNRPVVQHQDFMKEFWNNATIRMTVDGGTAKWDTFVSNLPETSQKDIKQPHLITGDFDSITENVSEKYKKKGCKFIHTPDQNYTDFTKSLIELNKYCLQHEIQIAHVVAIAQASGRLDQILGNIQTLFLAKDKNLLSPNTRLYLMTDDALSWLLSPGDHIIHVPEETRKHKRAWCSLVPIGGECERVTTNGLKWNLDNQPLKFGDVVSTSNTFSGLDTVKITCSNVLLWSMRLPSLFSGTTSL